MVTAVTQFATPQPITNCSNEPKVFAPQIKAVCGEVLFSVYGGSRQEDRTIFPHPFAVRFARSTETLGVHQRTASRSTALQKSFSPRAVR